MPSTPDEIVVAMIELRQKVDASLEGVSHPSEWRTDDLWSAPEYVIYSILRSIALLMRDGLPEAVALQRADERRCLNVLPAGVRVASVEDYLVRLLRGTAPEYLVHGPELLANAVVAARQGLRELPPPPFLSEIPPPDWRWQKIQRFPHCVPPFLERLRLRSPLLFPQSRYDEEFFDFVVRMQEGDELWEWSSPRLAWALMAGRAGVALVRDGRAIASVDTMMN